METDVLFDEKLELMELKKVLTSVTRHFDKVRKIRSGDPETLNKIENAMISLPSDEEISAVLEEVRIRAQYLVDEGRKVRAKSFKHNETGFLKKAKGDGKLLRETGNGWRVGVLEMQTQPELAKIRFAYNREPINKWRSVRVIEDFAKEEERSLAKLEKASIPEGPLLKVFDDAYDRARSGRSGKANESLVPILEFYREFRLALFRSELSNRSPHVKMSKYAEFPRWAFLYNLDRYRLMEKDREIGLQTGSQREVSQGKGMIVNGLDPLQDYKVMCYVVATRGPDR